MHPSIDQLLSVRDGEPVDAATRQHAESCVVCGASLRRLNERQRILRNLPQFQAPDIDFDRIRARALQGSQPETRLRHRWVEVAAAVLIVTATSSFFIGRDELTNVGAAIAPKSAAPASEPVDTQLARLVQQSRELDQLLRNMPPRPEVQRVALAGMVDRIEQRVQWLDVQLSSVPDSGADQLLAERLWRERVELMDSLVTVRYAEALPQSFPGDDPAG